MKIVAMSDKIDTGHTVRSLVSMLEGAEIHDDWKVLIDRDGGEIVLEDKDGRTSARYGLPPTQGVIQ